jgi:MFS family permease
VGSPLFSLLSDKFKNRRAPMLFGAIFATILYSIIVLIPNLPLTLMYVLMFCAGLAYSAKGVSFASICELMPPHMSGVSIAFINVGVMSAGIIFNPLMGTMLDWHWAGEIVNGAPFYDEAAFRFALLCVPAGLFLGILLALRIKESHPEASIVQKYNHMIDTEAI